MATQADIDAAVAAFSGLATDLAKWMNGLSVSLRASVDPKAALQAVSAAGASKAAELLSAGIVDLQNVYKAVIDTTIAGVPARHTGTVSQSFAIGAGPETHDVAVAAPWVTALTPEANIRGFCTADPTAGAGDIGLLMAYCKTGTISPGVGFTLRLFKPSYCTTVAASFPFFWVGYP